MIEPSPPPPSWIKRLLPKSLLARSLLILVTPLVVVQVVSAALFYQGHWDKISRRLALALAGDIGTVSTLLRELPDRHAWVRDLAMNRMEIDVTVEPGAILPNVPSAAPSGEIESLVEALRERLDKPFTMAADPSDRHVIVLVQHPDAVVRFTTTRKRLYSSTTYLFVLWTVGTSLLLLGVATIFMRNQVRPIRRLAMAAANFGKGRDTPHFKPEGAKEVRQAASAFVEMRDRINRHIGERTQMLAGVSHDLRTPLTRMRLQLAMLGDHPATTELEDDVAEMERMLEGYLAFARGEGGERPEPTELAGLLDDIVGRARRKGGAIDLHVEGAITLSLKPNAFRRCLTNLLDNATRYAKHVAVRAGIRDEMVEITVDDDGPGIPPAKRDEVFKPFLRLEESRNPTTGGVGLGLTIARDIVRGHGGEIALADSPSGGLRVRLRLPI